jgi:hypothetical protein
MHCLPRIEPHGHRARTFRVARMARLARNGGGALLIVLGLAAPLLAAAQTQQDAGRRIYTEGVLLSGAPLVGQRPDGTVARGADAACTNCHRPSGMGSVEGDVQVAPITGRFLFPQEGERPLATMDPRIGKRMSLKREPHTDATLAHALRTGQSSNGTDLSPLMPRYALGAPDMEALIAYLRHLSVTPSPGIDLEERTIRFATVVTPGVEPQRKKAMLDMLRTAFMQKNGSTITGNSGRRHMVTAAELVLGTENKWVLDVWELQGKPETWAQQLRDFNQAAPPFALVSGISNTTWEPVESFCESEHIPCWFPSVASVPTRAEQPRYSFYYNKGLTLEADLLAQQLSDGKPGSRILQLARSSDASGAAATLLEQSLHASTVDLDRWPREEWVARLTPQLQQLGPDDNLVLWLRPADLRELEAALVPVLAARYGSGTLLGGTAVFMPEALRENMRLAYPYEMPVAREGNVGYMHVWLKLRRIPIVDEALQSEVYFAVNFLTDAMAELLDNWYRDYLVERAEGMIGQRESRKAEDEMRDQNLVRPRIRKVPMDGSIPQPNYAPGRVEHMTGKREGTTVYPRLNLGPGQRLASKGAYIVRYDSTAPGLLVAETPWTVP